MSITKPIILDETGHLIVEGIARQNLLLTQMISAQGEATPVATLREIHEIVRAGEAPNVFSIGDQIMLNYNDGNQNYVLPWDIVHFGDVELQDGEIAHGMFIQSHYAMEEMAFDGNEAFYVAETALAAGTYYITMGNSWGNHVVANKSYEFTIASELPAGGLLSFGTAASTVGALPDTAPANWRVLVWEHANDAAPIARLTMTEGASGPSLGTLSSTTKYDAGDLNNMQRASYGYNRWSQSALRQRLNSSGTAGSWWTAQNKYDLRPDQLATLSGFMAGFDNEFLNIIKPVKVVTALNTVSDSDIGTSDVTYDTFFPAALEQEYIVAQATGVEGGYWEYWKRRLGLSSPQTTGEAGKNAFHIRYAYNAQTAAQGCRLRSASRGHAYNTWYVNTSGYASYNYATAAVRCAPACVIC